MMNALIMQRRRCHTNISMDVSITMNVLTTQCRRFYTNILMNTSSMENVTTMQHHIFNANTSMDISTMMNILISQLGTSCSFDSPGLARNEPTPGEHPQGDSTP